MEANATLLVIEDEEDIVELMRYHLTQEGFQVHSENQGPKGLEEAQRQLPDLILLDLMLPGIDGLEICKRLKSVVRTKQIPIIMLTAKGEESDIVKGLEMGADDYITKPFSPQVLVARVKAVLRRKERLLDPKKRTQDVLRMHDLVIHPGRFEVLLGQQKLQLTQSEFQILHLLAQRPGWVFTRAQIVDLVRGENYAVTDRSIDVQIVGLRRKLGQAGDYIETVRGVGYRFRESE